MNLVVITGNLTKDVELRYSTGADQMAIARFTVAVNDGYGEKQRTSFINVVVFGKQAESCDRYLAKGKKVGVTGRLQTGSYEKDGRKVYTTDVIAANVEFLSGSEKKEEIADANPVYLEKDFGLISSGFSDLVNDDIPF